MQMGRTKNGQQWGWANKSTVSLSSGFSAKTNGMQSSIQSSALQNPTESNGKELTTWLNFPIEIKGTSTCSGWIMTLVNNSEQKHGTPSAETLPLTNAPPRDAVVRDVLSLQDLPWANATKAVARHHTTSSELWSCWSFPLHCRIWDCNLLWAGIRLYTVYSWNCHIHCWFHSGSGSVVVVVVV